MSLIKVDKHTLFPKFSNVWEDFFGKDIMEMPGWRREASVPAVNIEDKHDSFEVEMAVPGMKRDDFKIEVDHGLLIVSAQQEAKQEDQDKEGRYTRREFSYHSFRRSFTLPEAVDMDKIDAKYKEGILHIHLPKKERTQKQLVKQIEIK